VAPNLYLILNASGTSHVRVSVVYLINIWCFIWVSFFRACWNGNICSTM